MNPNNTVSMQKQSQDLSLTKSPEFRSFFLLGERLQFMESQIIEYKNFGYPFDIQRKQILKEVICSFLNTKGGFLFIGVDNQEYQIYGITLTLSQKDNLKLDIIEILEKSFHPKVEMTNNPLVSVNFIPIKDQGVILPGKWVIRIVVEKGTDLYVNIENSNFISYQRMDGRKLTLKNKELYDEIVKHSLNKPHVQNEKLKYEMLIDRGEEIFDDRKQKKFSHDHSEKEVKIEKKKKEDQLLIFIQLQQRDAPFKDILEQLINRNSNGIEKSYFINEKERAIKCFHYQALKQISKIIKNKRNDLDQFKIFKSISQQKNGKIIYQFQEIFQKKKINEAQNQYQAIDKMNPFENLIFPSHDEESMICINNLEINQHEKLTQQIKMILYNNNLTEKSLVFKQSAIFIIFPDRQQSEIFKKIFLQQKSKRFFGQKIWLEICKHSFRLDMNDSELLKDILTSLKIDMKESIIKFRTCSEGIDLYSLLEETFQNLDLKDAKIIWQ